MTGVQSTLDAINAATGCQQCEGPLGDSPDWDFCGETCWELWHAKRVGVEPQRFGWGPPEWPTGGPLAHFSIDVDGQVTYLLQVDSRPFTEACRRLGESIRQFAEQSGPLLESTGIEAESNLADHMQRALESRRNRNTGPQSRQRAPRRIDPRRSR